MSYSALIPIMKLGFAKWRLTCLPLIPLMRLGFAKCLCANHEIRFCEVKTDVFGLDTNHEIGFCLEPLYQSCDLVLPSGDRCGMRPWYQSWDWVLLSSFILIMRLGFAKFLYTNHEIVFCQVEADVVFELGTMRLGFAKWRPTWYSA